MKEITRISLASLPYNIEIEAKKELERYLSAIERRLSADADAMKEIEARIAELLSERGVRGEKVVGSDDVVAVEQILGSPNDFAGESEATVDANQLAKKRLMRDPSRAVLGGVVAGLAAYSGIDIAIARLVAILLVFATGGTAIPVYIIAWIVIPPARTAAERLQMAGKPVTLAALQDQSAEMSVVNNTAHIVLTVLRVITGLGAIVAAIWAVVTVAMVVYSTAIVGTGEFVPQEFLSLVLMAAAGVLFALFSGLLGYMLLSAKFMRRMWVTLGVVGVIGLLLATASAANYYTFRAGMDQQYSNAVVEKRLDVAPLNGTKTLRVRSQLPVQVNYSVATPDSQAILSYNSIESKVAPEVNITRDGDVLTVSLDGHRANCASCRNIYTLNLSGPQLERIDVESSSTVRYITDGQKQLAVSASGDASVELQTTKTIDRLTAALGNGSSIDAIAAGIQMVDLTMEDAASSAVFATVKSMTLTVPESCSVTTNGMVRINKAEQFTVNKQLYDEDHTYSCMNIVYGNQP